MTDRTIPELVAQLREIDCDNWTLCIGEAVGALHEDSDRLAEAVYELRKALPVILDALKRGPWRPIAECGELETGGEYLVLMKRGKLEPHITVARWSGTAWQVRIVDAERYYYRAEHITHIHRMGPIRGPGER